MAYHWQRAWLFFIHCQENTPVVTLHESFSVDGRHREGKAWLISWVEGKFKEAIFYVSHSQLPILREH